MTSCRIARWALAASVVECATCAAGPATGVLELSVSDERGHERALRHAKVPATITAVSALRLGTKSARVLLHDRQWWHAWDPRSHCRPQEHGGWIRETAIDLDGDRTEDLARFAKGPQVTYEIRVRQGTAWRTTQRWGEPYVLDSEDCAPASQPSRE